MKNIFTTPETLDEKKKKTGKRKQQEETGQREDDTTDPLCCSIQWKPYNVMNVYVNLSYKFQR